MERLLANKHCKGLNATIDSYCSHIRAKVHVCAFHIFGPPSCPQLSWGDGTIPTQQVSVQLVTEINFLLFMSKNEMVH